MTEIEDLSNTGLMNIPSNSSSAYQNRQKNCNNIGVTLFFYFKIIHSG